MIMQEKAIHKEMVFLKQALSTKDDVIELLSDQAIKLDLINSKKDFKEAVYKREEMASTSIGYQIAIPHGISHTVNRAFIGFVQIKDAFHWNHDEKQSVQLIFLIGVPQDNQNNIHLKFISLLSRRLLDDNFRKQLIEVEDVEDAYTYMAQEAIEKECRNRGYEVKVETQGSMGIENELEQEEIDEADAVILAIAVGIDGEERFEEKQDAGKVIQVEPGDVIKDAVRVIDQAENL